MPDNRPRLFWSLLVVAAVARADAPPPAEFWDYYGEYGDTSGELFDPLDLGDAEAAAQQARTQQPLIRTGNSDQANVRRTDGATESEE